MEGTLKLLDAAPLGSQLCAAMQTGVHVSSNVSRRGPGPHHNYRVVNNVIHHMVTNVGDILQTAGPLPGLAPDFLHLSVMEGLIEVAVDGDIVASHVDP